MNAIGDSSAPLNGVRPDYLAKTSRCQKQETRGRGLSGNHTIVEACSKPGRPALKRGGPGNDALRVELRRSSSPNVGMRGAELKLPGFKDPATEMPTPPERSYSARAACAVSASAALREWPIVADFASLWIGANAWAHQRGGI